jgi:hypothetical protein
MLNGSSVPAVPIVPLTISTTSWSSETSTNVASAIIELIVVSMSALSGVTCPEVLDLTGLETRVTSQLTLTNGDVALTKMFSLLFLWLGIGSSKEVLQIEDQIVFSA